MKRSHLLPLACSLLAGPLGAQRTWFVDDDNCPGSGTQADPYCVIQVAIDKATSGDTILVLPGSYSKIDFKGKDVVVRSLAGQGVTKIQGAYGPTVRFDSGEGPGAALHGFDVAVGDPVILCIGTSPLISGNVIRHGYSGVGAGMQITGGAAPLVRGNEIRDNTATPGGGSGGGFSVISSSPRFENNVVHHNDAFEDLGGSAGGGGIVVNSTMSFVGNLFYANTCTDSLWNIGAGLYASDSTLTFIGNTFVGNAVPDVIQPGTGGAIALRRCVATFINHVSWNNVATRGPELAQVTPTGAIEVSYSLFEGGLGAVYLPFDVFWREGNIDTDPLFVAPAAHDYHVLPSSPVVDAGAPATPTGGTDGDLDPRILDGNGNGKQRADMGWDEVNPSSLVVLGTPSPGGSLTLQTSGPAGQVYGLAFALSTFDFTFAPYGSLLIDPTTIQVVASGLVPGSDVIAIPPDPGLLGTQVFFQALVRNLPQGFGSFTRRVALTVQQG